MNEASFNRICAILTAAGLAAALFAACSQGGTQSSSAPPAGDTGEVAAESTASAADGVITIKYPTYAVGANINVKAEQAKLARFEELYGDTIKLEIEELPSDPAYTDKMKILAASNELPDLVDGKNGLRDLAIKNGQAMDLLPVLEADPEYRADLGEESIQANMSEDGKLYSIVGNSQVVGYYYNKEMFADAGIEPAKTWDEFTENCEKLLAKGYTPMALMTGENSWTTNLLLSSMIGTAGEAGNTLMNTYHPETYQTPEVIDALERMKLYLQKYTTADAIGALYANAANNFEQEQAAMIFNGLWMTTDFTNPEKCPEGFDEKVGIAAYPEQGLIANYAEGFVVCSTTPEKQDAAVKLMKCFTDAEGQRISMELANNIPAGNNVEISEDFKAANPFFVQLMDFRKDIKYTYATFDVMAYASVVDAFGKYYPDLAYDTITAAEMAQKLDEAAASSK